MNTKPLGLLALLLVGLMALPNVAAVDHAGPTVSINGAEPTCDPVPNSAEGYYCRVQYAWWIVYEAYVGPVDDVYDCVTAPQTC